MILAPQVAPLEFKPTLELRQRFESRQDRDFDRTKLDRRTDLFTRIRPGFVLTSGKQWSLTLQGQFVSSLAHSSSKNFSLDDWDLFWAHITYTWKDGVVRAGRQRMVVGDQSLFGSSDFGNRGSSYDGVAMRIGKFEAMGGRIGVQANRPSEFRILALTYSLPFGLSQLYFKHDRIQGKSIDHFTLSQTGRIQSGPWSFEGEWIGQIGRNQGKDHRAWAMRNRASYTIRSGLRVGIDLNMASGGQSNRKSETFDPLVSPNHTLFGILDAVSWRNLIDLALFVHYQPNSGTRLQIEYHRFALKNPKDGWYSVGIRPVLLGLDPTGKSGRALGDEVSLDYRQTLNKWLTAVAGVSWMQPSTFINSLREGHATRQLWFYVGVTMRF